MVPNLGDEKNEPSLELPSLRLPGLGRRRKGRGAAGEPEAPAEPREDTTPPEVPVGEPAPEPQPEPAPEAQLEPQPVAAPAPEPTRELELPTPQPETVREPEAQRGIVPAPSEPAPEPERARRRASRSASPATPTVPGRLAAGLTGLLVGGAGAAATYGAMEGCEEVRGVSTCGGAPGFFILVAIVVLMVLLGSLILKALRVADTVSTSFLAVGIVTVVVMLTLLDQIFSVWMFAVIPVLTAAAYVLSHWVTTRFEHEDTGRRDWT